MIRAVFVLVPAVGLGALAALVNGGFGFAVFLGVATLGIDVTEPRAERGERGASK